MKPALDMDSVTGLWDMCVKIMDALEKQDGNDHRANEFFCRFMSVKDAWGPEDKRLSDLIERMVESS